MAATRKARGTRASRRDPRTSARPKKGPVSTTRKAARTPLPRPKPGRASRASRSALVIETPMMPKGFSPLGRLIPKGGNTVQRTRKDK